MNFNALLQQNQVMTKLNTNKGVVIIDRDVTYTNNAGKTTAHKVAEFYATEKPSEYYPNEIGVISLYPESAKVAEQFGQKVGADEVTVAPFFGAIRVTLEGSKAQNKEGIVIPLVKGESTAETLQKSTDLVDILDTIIKGGVSFSKKQQRFSMAKYRVLAVDGGVMLKKVGFMHK